MKLGHHEKHEILGHIKGAARRPLRAPKHVPQVDHSGKHRQVPAFGQENPNDRTPIGEHLNTHGYDGGKAPKPKNHGHVPVAPNMHRISNNQFESVSPTEVARAPDASGPLVTDPTIIGKRLSKPAVSFGMKRNGMSDGDLADLSRRVFAEAKRN